MDYKTATENLLFHGNDYAKIKAGIDFMHEQYAKITEIKAGDQSYENYIQVENGKIVTPVTAAHCLIDLMRTTQFLRGVYKAIIEKLPEAEHPIKILYAGCGPYATLLTPLTTLFSVEQVQFTLLEYNPISMKAVRKLYDSWGISEYIQQTIIGDATTNDIPIEDEFDIILSETMQATLRNECQVPLTRNLVRFLKGNGTFIPQNVYVAAHYMLERENELEPPKNEYIDTIYDLDFRNIPSKEHKKTINITKSEYNGLYYFTRIRVYENEVIEPYASGLTVPMIIGHFQQKPTSITFKYIENESPDFELSYESLS